MYVLKSITEEFIKYLYKILKTKSEFLYWKIVNINIEKLLKAKPGLTCKYIL